MPGWQALYKELKDKNFAIISVAQDTGGAKDAGPWITAAKPEYTALVDEQQIVTQKYGMVNVPTAVWIDERGRIVRPNEVAFIDDRFKSFTNMETAPYIDAIRDWAANGAKSIYVLSESEVRARLKPQSNDRVRADAEFALAEHLYKQGKGVDAIPHFKEADWIPIIGITSVRLGRFRTRTVITARTFAKKFRSSTANPITNRASCRA